MTNPEFPYHERLTLQNFTAFTDQTFEFVPGLNVLVGENGTGKTHVMKALYAWQMARHLAVSGQDADYAKLFTETYGAKTVSELQRTRPRGAETVDELQRIRSGRARTNSELQRARPHEATVSGKFGADDWAVGMIQGVAADNGVRPQPSRPVFIPAIEMMAHARNMNGILRDYADFDRTCFDFLTLVTAQPLFINVDKPGTLLGELAPLKKLVPGKVEWDEAEQRFYLQDEPRRLPFSLVAEGFRKVSALYRLVQMNWLTPGSVLFWDEPEVNLNPKWMDEVIEALVTLARSGVQIFLATHSYVILKEIDLVLRSQNRRTNNIVQARYFGLRKERGVSKTMWSDDFAAIEPNSILDQYDEMMMQDMALTDAEAKTKR